MMVAGAIMLSTGCGGSTSGTSRGDVETFDQLAQGLSAAATTYGSTMMGPTMTSVDACQRIHAAYEGQVRPGIAEMNQSAGRMDSSMANLGDAEGADFECVATSMIEELIQHNALACSWSDLQLDRLEATRHAQAMEAFASHLNARCGEIMSGIDGATPSWSPMFAGCAPSSLMPCCAAR
jgi:hypothetical protein